MAGLANAEGHLTKTYRYGVTGELTYGSATYENEYTYNGESYNPNIQSQYLWVRYYNAEKEECKAVSIQMNKLQT